MEVIEFGNKMTEDKGRRACEVMNTVYGVALRYDSKVNTVYCVEWEKVASETRMTIFSYLNGFNFGVALS